MKKHKFNYNLLFPMVAFFVISIISISSAQKMLSTTYNDIVYKQVIWYIIGILIIISMAKMKNNVLINNAYIIYVIGNVLLALLLIFGQEINGSKCWFIIPKLGSFQPSEFMKIAIILALAKTFKWFDNKYPKKNIIYSLMLLLISMVIVLIPSVLTFLEPDTGMVLIYFVIAFIMLFVYGIKKSVIGLISLIGIIIIGMLSLTFFQNEDLFINIFGNKFFYRIDRLLDWSTQNGMQLINASAAIKAAGLFGFGYGNTPIYFPEPHTDFIFSVFSSNFGLAGSLLLIGIIIYFDLVLINIAIKEKNKENKYIISGFVAMLMYQQVQNVAMNIGLLPITGITLPFISYGGSSLLSYMIIIGIIINITNKKTIQKG
ncbi:MAG: FtsW/RodA/SpoVE family cell cycle protein [Bacilli bacterium]